MGHENVHYEQRKRLKLIYTRIIQRKNQHGKSVIYQKSDIPPTTSLLDFCAHFCSLLSSLLKGGIIVGKRILIPSNRITNGQWKSSKSKRIGGIYRQFHPHNVRWSDSGILTCFNKVSGDGPSLQLIAFLFDKESW